LPEAIVLLVVKLHAVELSLKLKYFNAAHFFVTREVELFQLFEKIGLLL
jgi:hypothetical protein